MQTKPLGLKRGFLYSKILWVDIVFSLFRPRKNLLAFAQSNQLEIGNHVFRSFPDEETYLKIQTAVYNKNLILYDSFENPNQKILPILFFAKTVKSLGARCVHLFAPYLAYMRQDKSFCQGECESARFFASLISSHFDGLTTIAPHLRCSEKFFKLFTIPTQTISILEHIANWIARNIEHPILIGPDLASQDWVHWIGARLNAPFLILKKRRLTDTEVEMTLPKEQQHSKGVPVLIDDIISTGATVLKAVEILKKVYINKPICITVHALFEQKTYYKLLKAGVFDIISCNTVLHFTNQIVVNPLNGVINP